MGYKMGYEMGYKMGYKMTINNFKLITNNVSNF